MLVWPQLVQTDATGVDYYFLESGGGVKMEYTLYNLENIRAS